MQLKIKLAAASLLGVALTTMATENDALQGLQVAQSRVPEINLLLTDGSYDLASRDLYNMYFDLSSTRNFISEANTRHSEELPYKKAKAKCDFASDYIYTIYGISGRNDATLAFSTADAIYMAKPINRLINRCRKAIVQGNF